MATVKTIAMRRDRPVPPDGPMTADVHPDEVENYIAAGWVMEQDHEEIGGNEMPKPRKPRTRNNA